MKKKKTPLKDKLHGVRFQYKILICNSDDDEVEILTTFDKEQADRVHALLVTALTETDVTTISVSIKRER